MTETGRETASIDITVLQNILLINIIIESEQDFFLLANKQVGELNFGKPLLTAQYLLRVQSIILKIILALTSLLNFRL